MKFLCFSTVSVDLPATTPRMADYFNAKYCPAPAGLQEVTSIQGRDGTILLLIGISPPFRWRLMMRASELHPYICEIVEGEERCDRASNGSGGVASQGQPQYCFASAFTGGLLSARYLSWESLQLLEELRFCRKMQSMRDNRNKP